VSAVTARRRALVPAFIALAAAAAGACSEVGTDPSAPVSIAFDTLVSVVQGDTLRDSLGFATPLRATAFNTKGDTIHGAPFTFIARDTTNTLVVEPTGAYVVAKNGTAGTPGVTLQAALGSLQFTRPLTIVARPDSIVGTTPASGTSLIQAPDTAALRKKNLTKALTVRVLHDTTPAPTPVNSWRVSLAVLDKPDSLLDSVRVADANGAFIQSAVTAGDGTATAYLRLYPKKGLPNGLERDSVIVQASAVYRNAEPLRGSPVRIVVPFGLCTGPLSGCSP
jgi:hypothetical protein